MAIGLARKGMVRRVRLEDKAIMMMGPDTRKFIEKTTRQRRGKRTQLSGAENSAPHC